MSELSNVGTEGLFPPASAPSPEFLLADEESSSTYPLLTPSPTAEFDHPLAIDTPPVLAYERQLSPSSIDTDLSSIPTLGNAAPPADYGACIPPPASAQHDSGMMSDKMQDKGMGSSSSSSSALQDTTASAQLLNPHHYLVSDATCQENGGIKPGPWGLILGTTRNPKDFSFLSWNWPFIRKCCFWGLTSLTVACICVVIGYIIALPSRCDPPRAWYQGSLIYEIFPASFHDSDSDGIGDLKGISAKVHYLESMGVRGVRLNSIFPSEHFPEHYYNVENLTQIESSLGTFEDFKLLVKTLHEMNISLILDLPLGSFFKHQETTTKQSKSGSHLHHVIINNHIMNSNLNQTTYSPPDSHGTVADVLEFWLNYGVDGFYLKDLEALVHDDKFQQHIQEWKRVLKRHKNGFDNILICSEKVVKILENNQVLSSKLATVLTHFDLVDVHIEMSADLKNQIEAVQNGALFRRPGYPWPLWTLGGVDTPRLASRLASPNATLAAVLVGMLLPGTPSIYYGDEIGLDNVHDPEKDFDDLSHVHQLPMMVWSSSPLRRPSPLHWLSAPHHLNLTSCRWVAETAVLRDSSPSVYMSAIWKEGHPLTNTAVKYFDKTLVVLKRFYPRRHSYVIVANLGSKTQVQDLSKLFYGGNVVLSTGNHIGKYLTFHKLTLYPGEAMIVKLDK